MARNIQELIKIMRAYDLEKEVSERDLKEFEDELVLLTGRFGAVAKMRGYYKDPIGTINKIIDKLNDPKSPWNKKVAHLVYMALCAEAAEKQNRMPERVTEMIEGTITSKVVQESLKAIRGKQG